MRRHTSVRLAVQELEDRTVPVLAVTTNGSSLSRFDTGSLGTVTTVPITGMQAGETLTDIDVRPATQQLMGVGSTSRLYTLNFTTGVATPVGTPGAFTLNGTAFGADFNPVTDTLRSVSNTEQNIRVNPANGALAGTDTAINPAGNLVSIAYDRSFTGATATTLYGIDSAAGTLVTIGSINGSPNSPNGGQITTVGSLGLGTNLNEAIGFDIDPGTGVAYASITTGGISRLYTINLTTGAATLASSNAGSIGGGTSPFVGLTLAPLPTLSIDDVTVTEGNAGAVSATFTISLSAASGQTVTVSAATADGTAVAPGDYVAVAATPVSFAPGQTIQSFTVTVNGDLLDEADETFFVNLSGATNAVISDNQGAGTITDDDAPPTLSIDDVTVTEGNAGTVSATFTISLSAANGQTVTVSAATADGTAAARGDYVAVAATPVSFAPGQTIQTFTVLVNGDLLDEADETFFVNLSGATNATILDNQGAGTITDDDAPPTLSIDDVTVTEGNAGTVSATFTISLSAASGQTVTVSAATADGTAAARGDYVAVAATPVSFAPGQTIQTFTVLVNGDLLDEADETFFVNLSGATNATILDGQGAGTITDDDAPPTLSIDDVTVTEGNAGTVSATFTISLSAASGQTVTVSAATADGTAVAPGDYVAVAATPVSFAPGQTTQSFTVLVNGDLLDEADETFFVNLSGATNATISDNQGAGTITDDDAPPTLSINDVTVTEGNAGTVSATFTLGLSAASGQTVTVSAATANGTAAAPGDYVAVAATPVSFAPGQTTQSFTVLVNGDLLDEADETFFVNLSGATNATISDNQGAGTITDDDAPPTVTLGLARGSLDEEGGVATLTVTLSAVSGLDVTVDLGFTGSATFGADYTASERHITIPAGSRSASVTLTGVGDRLTELAESVVVDITGVTNGIEIGVQEITATIGSGDVTSAIAVGSDQSPVVNVLNLDGTTRFTIAAFDPKFTGGVRVATGDVTGDQVDDIIVGAGPGGGAHVKVYDGVTGTEIRSFFAFVGFTGGVFVGAGDVDGDGRDDIIVGAGAGGSPHVKVFDAVTNADIRSFFAFEPKYTGGVTVAGGDVTGDGRDDIIVGAGTGANPHVKAFDAVTNADVRSFFAFVGFAGGVFVGAGDVDGDGRDDIFAGVGTGNVSHVKVFDAVTNDDIRSFLAFPQPVAGGVRVAGRDLDGDDRDDIIVGAGSGGQVRAFSGLTIAELANFSTFEIPQGVFVG